MMHRELPLLKSFYNSEDSSSLSIKKQVRESTCLESYQIFKKCSSQSRGTEGFNCTEAVGAYMKCVLGGNCRADLVAETPEFKEMEILIEKYSRCISHNIVESHAFIGKLRLILYYCLDWNRWYLSVP